MSLDTIVSPSRITAPLNGLRRELGAWHTARRDAEAFRRAGRELAKSPALADDDRLGPFHAALSRHQARLELLELTLAASQERERTDCVAMAPWVRPLIVLRGVSDRALVHYQLRRYRREMDVCHEALGRSALSSPMDGATLEPPAPALRFRRLRLARVAKDEGRALSGAVLQQLRGKLVPRASALAGLAAGWWVTSTYTDSHLRSIVNTIGIGKGGTQVVSGTTYKAMNFWVPILAAAVCAYLGDRLARAIRQRQQVEG